MDKLKLFFASNKDAIIKPTLVITVICIAVTLVLAVANLVTVGRIEQLAKQQLNESMQKVLKADEYLPEKVGDAEYYTTVTSGEAKGYIFTTTAKGYGGEIKVMTAISPEGKVIAVDILEASNETPGLGQNVTKEGFYSQFKDKSAGIGVVKGGSNSSGNEINAVTGATISSRAVTSAVNEALELFDTLSKTPMPLEGGDNQ